ncbi:MAG: Flp family type IVb pilin [bacterium]
MDKLMRFLKDEEGAGAVEYALLLGLIALAILVGAGALGINLNQYFQDIANRIPSFPR